MNRENERNCLLVEGWATPWQRTVTSVINETHLNEDLSEENNPLLDAAARFAQNVATIRDKFVGDENNTGFLRYLDGLLNDLQNLLAEDENATSIIEAIKKYVPDGFRKDFLGSKTNPESIDMKRWADTLLTYIRNGKQEDCLELIYKPDVYFLGFDDTGYEKITQLHQELFELTKARIPGDDSDVALTIAAKMATLTDHIAYYIRTINKSYIDLCNAVENTYTS